MEVAADRRGEGLRVDEIAVLGVGMHPWGKWGRNFADYGVAAARAALSDADVDYRDVRFVSGAITVRCGYPGYVAGSTFARALGFTGAQVASSYAACASGATALSVARGQILSGATEVALVIGADTTPKGFLAPNAGERPDDMDWLRFHLVGATNPVYFGLHARRRMDLYGAPAEDFARVGGLGAFGEAVPAQAIAQVCELTWQLRGQTGDRQVEAARVGVTANQGLFGHGSSVLVKR